MASISSGLCSISGKDKYVLNFDLDETLFEVSFLEQEDSSSGLSISESSTSDTGVLYNASLWKIDYSKNSPYRISAIAREKFKELFGKITRINKEAEETVIFLNIITNASYTEQGVVEVLRKFYGDDFTIHKFTNRERTGYSKGRQMLYDYIEEYWGLEIPRDHIYLIDDKEECCKNFEAFTFKAIRMVTDPSYRSDEPNQEVFETLNKIVDSVMEKVFVKIKD